MMRIARLLLFTVCLSTLNQLCAQVPQLINFQGRVAVDGVNFNGAAEFKFALVNGDGSSSFWSNDGSSANGNEPSNAVPITVSQGLYAVLLGDATLTNMTPISAAIFTNSDVRLRIWFNDGTNGFQQLSPDQRIAAVGYAMMAANVADGVVTSAKLADGAVTSGKLAVGVVTATSIAPHSIGSAQLATNAAADSLHDSGGLVLSDQSNAANLLNAGYIRIGQVTTDVDYWRQVGVFTPAARYGHTAVWTGSEMIIWGGNGPQKAMDGYYLPVNTGARYNPATDTWTAISTNGAPLAITRPKVAAWTGWEMIVWKADGSGSRYNPVGDFWRPVSMSNAPPFVFGGISAVWTGSEFIIWGGNNGSTGINTGARYNPLQDTWTPTSTNGAPTGRLDHTAVWSGNEMIVWGGLTSTANFGYLNTGARYNPAADTWRPMTRVNAPTGRSSHAAVWTGNEMIVWGGLNNNGFVNTGGRYNPATDSWISTSLLNAPSLDASSSAVWSGNEMIVWNGNLASGARYNPVTNGWTQVRANNAPSARSSFSAVWSGNEMIVWGGFGVGRSQGQLFNSGGRYNPLTGAWLATAANPLGRTNHTAIWTGAEMIIWGGQTNASDQFGRLNTGGRFNLATGRWTPTSLINAPSPRSSHTTVWTGHEMIVWGGAGPGFRFNEPGPLETKNDGGRYNPARDQWTSIETNGAPVARTGHTAVWTGNEMMVWGGTTNPSPFAQASFLVNSGARYDPQLNAWTSMASGGAPTARIQHSAVWTGDEMIVWGGFGVATTNVLTQLKYLNTGARYFPNLNAWIATTTNGTPQSIPDQTAVWTGKELIVWGSALSRARYNPSNDSWTSIQSFGAPIGGPQHIAVWTGSEMIVWGGSTATKPESTGGRYSPDTDTWRRITIDGMPTPRAGHAAVWTGDGMLIFGGTAAQQGLPDTTFLYSLTKPMYLYKKP